MSAECAVTEVVTFECKVLNALALGIVGMAMCQADRRTLSTHGETFVQRAFDELPYLAAVCHDNVVRGAGGHGGRGTRRGTVPTFLRNAAGEERMRVKIGVRLTDKIMVCPDTVKMTKLRKSPPKPQPKIKLPLLLSVSFNF